MQQQQRGGTRRGAGRPPSGNAAKDRIVTALADGPGTISELSAELELCLETIRSAVGDLKRAGIVRSQTLHIKTAGRPPCLYTLTGLAA